MKPEKKITPAQSLTASEEITVGSPDKLSLINTARTMTTADAQARLPRIKREASLWGQLLNGTSGPAKDNIPQEAIQAKAQPVIVDPEKDDFDDDLDDDVSTHLPSQAPIVRRAATTHADETQRRAPHSRVAVAGKVKVKRGPKRKRTDPRPKKAAPEVPKSEQQCGDCILRLTEPQTVLLRVLESHQGQELFFDSLRSLTSFSTSEIQEHMSSLRLALVSHCHLCRKRVRKYSATLFLLRTEEEAASIR